MWSTWIFIHIYLFPSPLIITRFIVNGETSVIDSHRKVFTSIRRAKNICQLIPHPHLLVPGPHRTVSTSKGYNQWLSLAKALLKVALASGNCSLVARTSKCGRAIDHKEKLKFEEGQFYCLSIPTYTCWRGFKIITLHTNLLVFYVF